jgi:ABC-type glutathione transport system ATPase component
VPEPIAECIGVSKSFAVTRGGRRFDVQAVDNVTLSASAGETLGLVGESGSGKSTLGRLIAALVAPSSGEVKIGGVSTADLAARDTRALRRRVQIVWQNPFASMNARDTIATIVTEAPIAHGLIGRKDRQSRAEEILELVGLPLDILRKRPSQVSGGQLQRVAIARSLALAPELLICDEVTSALDVSVQAQILNLLYDVQQRTNLGYIFISHDLHVVKHISDYVAVMFGGRVVEHGPSQTVYASPQHAYTRELVRIAHGEALAVPAS